MKNIFKLVSLLCILFSLPSHANDQDQQIKIISDFYKAYFSGKDPLGDEAWPSFFSNDLVKHLDQNKADCERYDREGSVCGYSADFDPFTFSQDWSSELTFASSEFSAKSSSHNAVDIHFILFPEFSGEDRTSRSVRVLFIKENDQWKVNDMLLGENGDFSNSTGIRQDVASERIYLIENNQLISNTTAVLETIIHYQQTEFFEKFISSETDVCQQQKCKPLSNSESLLQALHQHYFIKIDEYSYKAIKPLFDKTIPETKNPKAGDKITAGIFSFEYKDHLWMITKIDLDKMTPP